MVGATNRQFKQVSGGKSGPTRLKASGADYFDLTPDDDQKMIVETVSEFAEEMLRPAAQDADDSRKLSSGSVAKATELGITAINIPEDFDGIAEHRARRDQRAGRRGTRLRRHGVGSADPRPRRRRVGPHALGQRRPAGHLSARSSQARTSRRPAWRSPNRTPLFDPTALKTTAVRTPSGYRLDGVKSLVLAAADAELFDRRARN